MKKSITIILILIIFITGCTNEKTECEKKCLTQNQFYNYTICSKESTNTTLYKECIEERNIVDAYTVKLCKDKCNK